MLCEKCNNDICKVYGGICRRYRFIHLVRKLFLKGGEVMTELCSYDEAYDIYEDGEKYCKGIVFHK